MPEGIILGTFEAESYLAGEKKFYVEEYEVFKICYWSLFII